MIVIYGTRHYGRIDEYFGEVGAVRFVHLFFLPVIPIGWMWIRFHDEDGFRGHGMRIPWRALLSAYARTWGVGGGIVLLLAATQGRPLLALAGALLLVASLATFAWRTVWRPHAKRAREMLRQTIETACDPSLLPARMVAALRPPLEAAWAETYPDDTPTEVARHGPASPEQGALAYAILRLTARTLPLGQARETDRLAARLAAEQFEPRTARDGSPYRQRAAVVAPTETTGRER
jgi:hypothetical protein